MEKVRGEDARRLLMRCAAKYAMNEVNHDEFFNNTVKKHLGLTGPNDGKCIFDIEEFSC